MKKKILLCPECGYDEFDENGKVKCQACGVSFANMREIEKKQKEAETHNTWV
jgi:uncharacterized Zn finger protein (UPF0148 family)